MERNAIDATPEYAATGMDFRGGRETVDAGPDDAAADDGDDPFGELLLAGAADPKPEPNTWSVEQRFGRGLLRLRLYRGLSQAKLERLSGVDQTMISRLETGKSRGTTNRRVFAILRALRAEEITFGPGPRTIPQSSWEDFMYGDLWERAGRVAAARLERLNRRRSA